MSSVTAGTAADPGIPFTPSVDSPRGHPLAPAPLEPLPTNQLIVKFSTQAATPLAMAARTSSLRAVTGVELSYFRDMSGGATVYRLPSRMPEADVQAMADAILRQAADLGVEYAQPDSILLPLNHQRDADGPSLTPSDAMYSQMWHLQAVSGSNYGANLPGAWDITTGASGVRVAVIDTGIRAEHPDLAGRIQGGYDMVSDVSVANDGDGRDADASDPGDWITPAEAASGIFAGCGVHNSSWHGTHVAGTIGGLSNNGAGITGINWVSKVVPVRVLGKCGGASSDIIDGMRWAAGLSIPGVPANPNPARVLNLSLGGVGACSAAEQAAIDDVNAASGIVVIAAGNSNIDSAGFQPANCNRIIAVAATNKIGDIAAYSNYGSKITLSAPGGDTGEYGDHEGVLSTINLGATTPGASGYTWYQGTSMAAPHVAGIVSLMLSANGALTRDEVIRILRASATPFPANSTCSFAKCGAGIINAALAVDMARAGYFRQLYVPVVSRPGTPPASQGIHGTVTLNGSPIAGIGVQLRRRNMLSGSATTVATTATDADGLFKFTGAATLAANQGYYVLFTQAGDPSRLSTWVTKLLPIYTAGQSINIGSFDLSNIALSAPGAGATVTLPYAFSWVKRPAAPTDSYGLQVYDTGDYNPFFYTEPALGYVDSHALQPGELGSGFVAGATYGWSVFTQSPEHGYGYAYYYRTVKFNNP